MFTKPKLVYKILFGHVVTYSLKNSSKNPEKLYNYFSQKYVYMLNLYWSRSSKKSEKSWINL